MTLQGNGKYETEEEKDDEPMPPLEDIEEDESPVHNELLIARKTLSVQVREDEAYPENIFHTRCLVQGNLCSMIIDGGSCTNLLARRWLRS